MNHWDDFEDCESISDIHIKRFKSPEVVPNKDLGFDHVPRYEGFFETIGKIILSPFLRQHHMRRLAKKQDPSTKIAERETSMQEVKKSPTEMNYQTAMETSHTAISYLFLKRSLFQIPWKYIDVSGQSQTELDSAEERAINDTGSTDSVPVFSDDWVAELVT